MLEWPDFYLYATMASIAVTNIFFDKADPKAAALNAFAEPPEYNAAASKVMRPTVFKDLFVGNLKGLGVVSVLVIGYNAMSYIFKPFSLAYLPSSRVLPPIPPASPPHLRASWRFSRSRPLAAVRSHQRSVCPDDLWSTLGFFAYSFMNMLGSGVTTLTYVAVVIGTGILAPLMFSPQGSFLSRQFSVHTRSTAVDMASEFGTALAGGLAPLWTLSMVAQSTNQLTVGVVTILAEAAIRVFIPTAFDQGHRFSQGKNQRPQCRSNWGSVRAWRANLRRRQFWMDRELQRNEAPSILLYFVQTTPEVSLMPTGPDGLIRAARLFNWLHSKIHADGDSGLVLCMLTARCATIPRPFRFLAAQRMALSWRYPKG